MSQDLKAGDFLVFQLEAGFGLLRLLAVDEADGAKTFHLAAYDDFFPDVDTAEAAALSPQSLSVSSAHLALTERAFESTQVARIGNSSVTDDESQRLSQWRASGDHEISDRSVRLMLGLR
jgi:hypothetical protein